MEIRPVLTAALILVACGSLGILVVRLSNPLLKGLGWLSGSFAAGAFSVLLISLSGKVPFFASSIVGNWLTLFGFTLCNASILQLTEYKARLSRLSVLLLALALVQELFFSYVHPSHAARVQIGGLLFATQALESAWHLLQSPRKGLRAPIWFCTVIFFVFATFNILRSFVVFHRGLADDPFAPNPLQMLGVVAFLATALGSGFGLFWLANAKLRIDFERLASLDPLTGVENRRMFLQTCQKERSRSVRTGEKFSLLIGDIDHFKQINDRYGHIIGDQVLCAMAHRIQSALRISDTLGRWGGEEFVVLLPACPIDDAIEKAERLRLDVGSLTIPSTSGDIKVTISFGVATFLGPHDIVEDLFRRADAALYRAKALGRNRVCAHDGTRTTDSRSGEYIAKVAI